jgi:hypothetical protein
MACCSELYASQRLEQRTRLPGSVPRSRSADNVRPATPIPSRARVRPEPPENKPHAVPRTCTCMRSVPALLYKVRRNECTIGSWSTPTVLRLGSCPSTMVCVAVRQVLRLAATRDLARQISDILGQQPHARERVFEMPAAPRALLGVSPLAAPANGHHARLLVLPAPPAPVRVQGGGCHVLAHRVRYAIDDRGAWCGRGRGRGRGGGPWLGPVALSEAVWLDRDAGDGACRYSGGAASAAAPAWCQQVACPAWLLPSAGSLRLGSSRHVAHCCDRRQAG